eukprot:scpid95748/ scgid30830/ 
MCFVALCVLPWLPAVGEKGTLEHLSTEDLEFLINHMESDLFNLRDSRDLNEIEFQDLRRRLADLQRDEVYLAYRERIMSKEHRAVLEAQASKAESNWQSLQDKTRIEILQTKLKAVESTSKVQREQLNALTQWQKVYQDQSQAYTVLNEQAAAMTGIFRNI